MNEERFQDDRTEEQKKTHYYLWGGTDRFMSSFGPPAQEGCNSFAFWACKPEHANKVESWIRRRGDIMRVRQVGSSYKNNNHYVHIYVVDDDHPAVK